MQPEFGVALQVHEATPTGGHFSPTRSERIDKMYKEVRTVAAKFWKLARALLYPASCAQRSRIEPVCTGPGVALHVISLLQVHDFAQLLKECERQVKQLEIASAGTQPEPRCLNVRETYCPVELIPFLDTAVFKTAGDTLSRPLPHLYQADQQGSAVPIVPPDEMRQDVGSSMGTAVCVQDLSSISQKHVSCDIVDYLKLLHRFTVLKQH